MRFFKRRSPEPPELVRLCRLPPEEALHHHSHNGGEVEGGQPAAMSAPLVHRAAISRNASPTATLVRLRQQRRGECFCGSAKQAMALSSETRGAGGPVDVVSPASTVPRCCFVEATGAARTATPPGSAKLKRGEAPVPIVVTLSLRKRDKVGNNRGEVPTDRGEGHFSALFLQKKAVGLSLPVCSAGTGCLVVFLIGLAKPTWEHAQSCQNVPRRSPIAASLRAKTKTMAETTVRSLTFASRLGVRFGSRDARAGSRVRLLVNLPLSPKDYVALPRNVDSHSSECGRPEYLEHGFRFAEMRISTVGPMKPRQEEEENEEAFRRPAVYLPDGAQ
ncbi:hypothetical protein HPB51_008689 [Rhipicephalus microplus]|uniref:Uncharacterized protein n=1 Tax=Rhipicephalus microplus TaxID=6941 RepID=A0A9J6EZT9_RHIMP|nr:hypothetical protein HPB51_008689 [Rhipicephalus microplus]